ncbi:MAG: V-type ATPase subunit [Nanobdellota archaeon]
MPISITSDMLTTIIALSALVILFIITISLYYYKRVKPFQPFLYLSTIISSKEHSIILPSKLSSHMTNSLSSFSQSIFSKSLSTINNIEVETDNKFSKEFNEIYVSSPIHMKSLLDLFFKTEEFIVIHEIMNRFLEIHAGVSSRTEKKESLSDTVINSLPRGTLSKKIISESLSAKSYAELSTVFSTTDYYLLFSKKYASIEEFDKELYSIILKTYQKARPVLSKRPYKPLLPFISSFIDLYNVSISIHRLSTPSSKNTFWSLDGGFIPAKDIDTISSYQDLKTIIVSFYPEISFSKSFSFIDFKTQLFSLLLSRFKQQQVMYFQHPLRVYQFIFQKYIERINIRTMALGIESKFLLEKIKPMLIE